MFFISIVLIKPWSNHFLYDFHLFSGAKEKHWYKSTTLMYPPLMCWKISTDYKVMTNYNNLTTNARSIVNNIWLVPGTDCFLKCDQNAGADSTSLVDLWPFLSQTTGHTILESCAMCLFGLTDFLAIGQFLNCQGNGIPQDLVAAYTYLTIMDPLLWDDLLSIMCRGETLKIVLPTTLGLYFCVKKKSV